MDTGCPWRTNSNQAVCARSSLECFVLSPGCEDSPRLRPIKEHENETSDNDLGLFCFEFIRAMRASTCTKDFMASDIDRRRKACISSCAGQRKRSTVHEAKCKETSPGPFNRRQRDQGQDHRIARFRSGDGT